MRIKTLKSFELTPLCLIETPFKEKFGVPRQPMLIPEALGKMEFPKNDFFMEAFRGIEGFSHLWLIFSFHQAIPEGHKALVRPPRFSGKEKWGVFATRSPHRPNHLGLSVVKFKSIEIGADKITLLVEGVDLVSGTPIMDIKPYIAYTDAYSDALSGAFQHRPEFKTVKWMVAPEMDSATKILIEKVIGLDPRSNIEQMETFGVSIAGYNIRFRMSGLEFEILEVTRESL
jgi:tRNA-Thr(GGU) m(6)t(6)A37 methyltransferase TsaA